MARPLAVLATLSWILLVACGTRSMAQDRTPLVLAATADTVALREGVTDAPLQVVSGQREIGPRASLADRLRGEGAGRQIYLTLAAPTVQAPPGVTYNVYLNRPSADTAEGAASPYFLGSLSFFNAGKDPGRDVSLNVTAALDRLLARGALDADLRVSIAPAGAPDPAAAPRIERLRLIAR